MLHQTIPQYEGSQPFLYACYCAEDEALAFPILARMYNEGFRLWTSRAGGGAYEFRSAQRLSSASYVLVFHSQNLIERLRLGDAEVATALKNPMLRTVVTLDDNAPDSKMFALSTPDAVDYKPGNDAGFWLYIYSSDSLEKCRGPWPENKLLLRDAVYEDVSEEVVKTEYDAIASFMESFSQKAEESEKKADYGDSRYRNNAGYIPPERDDNVYIPLEKVNAARTVHDKAFDEVIGMIDEFVDNAAERKNAPREEKIIPKKQVAAASVPKTVEVSDAPSDISAPVLSFAQPQEKRDTAISETVAQVRPQENKPSDDDEGKEYRPKADFVFTPEARRYDIKDYFPDGQYPTAYSASAPPVASGASSVTMTATATVPQVAYYQVAPDAELAQAASRAQAVVYMSPQLLQAAQASSADKNAPIALIPVVAPETAPVSAPDAAEAVSAQPEQPAIAAPEAAEREAEAEQKQTAVTVVVRRQNAVEATKVTPVKKCTLTATVQRATKTLTKGGEQPSRVQLQRPEREVITPSVSIPVIAAESAPTESAPSARKHRGKAVADVPCDVVCDVRQSASISDDASQGDAQTARKNKYPHKSDVLSGLLSALRRESVKVASDSSQEQAREAETAEPETEIPVQIQAVKPTVKAAASAPKASASRLGAAIEKFVARDKHERTIPVVVKPVDARGR